jgi:UDPglucose 6-dehydrogenase
LTHLGIVSAIATAARGFRVRGHHAEASLIGRLHRQDLPIREPDLGGLLAANGDRMSFSATATDLSDCDIVYDRGRSSH